ncbi:hypothetical protein AQ925_29560 [Burkholderia pseudomallei]|nr:hypothetical protein AQ806_27240 [Burkholderia pseudomallei]OMW55709.1 hypothetical protein AQ810_30065 [Burkholderia pseudomallei]ONB58610.1 hypothetical protein AQ902_02155 [Burkholderia pseudomallei]ONB88674.1 hypothetical protein AQ906_12735 [Burkholderia pseudomallei]ONC07487.1 hypothetical protein AQ909_28410 [Burkholderia pseudomallei]
MLRLITPWCAGLRGRPAFFQPVDEPPCDLHFSFGALGPPKHVLQACSGFGQLVRHGLLLTGDGFGALQCEIPFRAQRGDRAGVLNGGVLELALCRSQLPPLALELLLAFLTRCALLVDFA